MEDVARAKNEKKPTENRQQFKTGSSSKAVASVQEMSSTNQSHTEDVDENAVFAIFGPTASSSVIGNGSFSEGDISVSLPPLRSKHFVWKCTVDGPNVDFPLTVSTLIDNGAHVVLIRPEVVQKLGLPIHQLAQPECIDVAIDSSNKEKKARELSEYVLLSVASLDQSFHAKPVRALLTPGLCMPVILGLPWLEKNKIVCDHADRSCYVKPSGYNLLHPPKILPPPPPKPKLKVQLRENRELKKRALKELVMVVKEKWLPRRAKDEEIKDIDIVAMIRNRIATIAIMQDMEKREQNLKDEFRTVFEPIPHIDELPTDVLARIKLKEADKIIRSRTYPSPRKYAEAWSTLIQEHLHAGRICPSASSFASPAFLIPKSDPSALPCWVNDFHQLNANTVTDCHPLPRIDDILNDCAKGRIWATIDMTNSFFQTRMHPDDIPLTAVNTPLGLYEWLVMPMGLKNAPSIHQRRVTSALRRYIGRICHIYLDDIVIWSNSIEEHEKNVRLILQALQAAKLYVNPKKCKLFCTEIHFLGHKVSQKGIEADEGKADRILHWPKPRSAQDVRSFLGLVRYLAAFLPKLVEFTSVLGHLTHQEAEANFPLWTNDHQMAFDNIKQLVASRECLTTIDLTKLPQSKIFVTTDASDIRSGAVLSFGETWESARPVAFDS